MQYIFQIDDLMSLQNKLILSFWTLLFLFGIKFAWQRNKLVPYDIVSNCRGYEMTDIAFLYFILILIENNYISFLFIHFILILFSQYNQMLQNYLNTQTKFIWMSVLEVFIVSLLTFARLYFHSCYFFNTSCMNVLNSFVHQKKFLGTRFQILDKINL